MMSAFQHACYRVGNIDRSLAFYAALGFEERKRYHLSDTETKVMIGLPGDGDRIGLTYLEGVTNFDLGTGFNHIALTVADVHASLDALAAHDVVVEQAPFRLREGGSLIAFIEDPDGYRIELIEKQ